MSSYSTQSSPINSDRTFSVKTNGASSAKEDLSAALALSPELKSADEPICQIAQVSHVRGLLSPSRLDAVFWARSSTRRARRRSVFQMCASHPCRMTEASGHAPHAVLYRRIWWEARGCGVTIDRPYGAPVPVVIGSSKSSEAFMEFMPELELSLNSQLSEGAMV